jgi:hypothetical protein
MVEVRRTAKAVPAEEAVLAEETGLAGDAVSVGEAVPAGPDRTAGAAPLTESEVAELVSRRLTAILRVVQLESAGQPVEVDGFRFRPRGERGCGS